MEVEPISGFMVGLEHVTNPLADAPEEAWYWAYILCLGIVKFSFVKYK